MERCSANRKVSAHFLGIQSSIRFCNYNGGNRTYWDHRRLLSNPLPHPKSGLRALENEGMVVVGGDLCSIGNVFKSRVSNIAGQMKIIGVPASWAMEDVVHMSKEHMSMTYI